MEVIRTISVDKNNVNFPANWEEGTNTNKKMFTVTIDGKTTGGGFRYDTGEDDWFDVILTDNTFTVIAKENFNLYERNGYITIHHNCIRGDSGEVTVFVNQSAVECNISVSDEIIEFVSNSPEVSKKEIMVTVTGGNEKYFIKSFKKYSSEIIPSDGNAENTNTMNKVIPNDKGIKLEKSDNKLIITSYGRTSLKNGQFYEIIVAHEDDSEQTAKILVTYDTYAPKNSVPPIQMTNNRRLMHTKSLGTENNMVNIPTFAEIFNESILTIEPSLTIYGLNEQIPSKKRGRKSKLSNEIIFESQGGSISYNMIVIPDDSMVSVSISSNFVKYEIGNEYITLTAEPNLSGIERKCMFEANNVRNPYNKIIKTIIQKGTEK